MSARTNKLIKELFGLDRDIQKLEDQISRMKARRHMLATVDLPEAMTEIGSSYIELDDGSGLSCAVDYKIYGSLPSRDKPDERHAAIEYLRENDAEGIIKANLLVEFGKGDIRGANKLRRALEARSMTNQPISVDCDVHHSSLAAWGRERVKNNIPTKLEVVGLRGLTMATVKKALDR